MKPKLGSGKRFEKLAEKVEKSYEKKGMSPAKAEKVGGAVAAKQMWSKYGKKKGAELIKKGKK
jgi:hypothetical protein